MKAIKTVVAYSVGNRNFVESFITVAEMGANGIANLFKAHPELLQQQVTINSVTQYDSNNRKV